MTVIRCDKCRDIIGGPYIGMILTRLGESTLGDQLSVDLCQCCAAWLEKWLNELPAKPAKEGQ